MPTKSKRMRRTNLPEDPPPDLLHEIHILRTTIQRVYELIEIGGEQDLEPLCKALSALGVASTRLARLLAAQRDLSGPQGNDELAAAISAVLKRVE